MSNLLTMLFSVSLTGLRTDSGERSAAVDERTLLERARSGDRGAAEELVERTYSMIYAALYRLCGGDSDRAADLTQETYQKAWEALGEFEARAKFSTWLYRIAYTTFLNQVRRPHRIVPLEDPVAEKLTDDAPPPDAAIETSEVSSQVRQAVLGLPEEVRFTVTAHFWGGLAVKEIARLERVTTVAIRKRLRRAFVLLETALASEVR